VGSYSDENDLLEDIGDRGDDVQPGGEGGGGSLMEESFDADLVEGSDDDEDTQ
jgi:hypothetical protein